MLLSCNTISKRKKERKKKREREREREREKEKCNFPRTIGNSTPVRLLNWPAILQDSFERFSFEMLGH